MKKGKKKFPLIPVLISCAVSILLLVYGIWAVDGLTLKRWVGGLFFPLVRLMFFIFVGLLAGQIIEAAGWTRFLAWLARPLFRFGNLGEHCSAAFTAAFFSGTAANAMLFDFYTEKIICRKQLFLTNFVNHLPAYVLHVPTTFFIILPLTGFAGALYFLLTFIATLLRTSVFLVYGHFNPSIQTCEYKKDVSAEQKDVSESKGMWEGIREKLPARITRIAVFVVPIYIAVFLMNAMGFFEFLEKWLAGYVVTSFIPMESLAVVILSLAAEFTSGFAAAGALMDAGVLTVKQTVIALLIGNIVAFPVRALRHQLPRYIGIFSPKMGTQLLLMGQGFRVLSIIVVGTVYFLIG